MTITLEPPVPKRPRNATGDCGRDARRKWIGFAVILSAMILNILDSTILNVAAPSIQRDLTLSASALEWIAAAYTLAIAVGLLAGGRLGDAYGRKRMLMAGLVGFVASSVVCSLAWSGEALVAGRVAQGLAAALMIPQTFGLIRDIFGPAEIGKAFAAFGPAIGLSTVLGPVVAGAPHQARRVRDRLALAVPDQRARRAVRDRRRPPGAARERARAPRRPPRLGRYGADGRGQLPPRVPARRGPHPGLAGLAGRRRGRGAAARGDRRTSAARPDRPRRDPARRAERAAQAVLRLRRRVHPGVLRQHRRLLVDHWPVPPDRPRHDADAGRALPGRLRRRRVLRLGCGRLGDHRGRPPDPARGPGHHGRRDDRALPVDAVAPRPSAGCSWSRAWSSTASGWA